MQWFDTIILGLVQGLTEFIPVSSSGHLIIAQTFLTGAADHLFLEFIDVGTTLALIVFFRRRIWGILVDIFQKKKYKLARNIIITIIPAGAIGFFMSKLIEQAPFFNSLLVVTVALAVVGFFMVIADKLPHASEVVDGEKLTVKRALFIGVLQVFSLIPGVSRSGSTILAGRFMGLKPAEAAEYSFLVSIPIMLGVMLKVFLTDHAYLTANLGTLFVSNLVAFISGLIAVGFLIRYLSHHSLAIFGWYRLGLALVLTIVLIVR
jgi:undecaprenyl-diphosphatase